MINFGRDTCNPMIEVQSLGVKKYSQTKTDIGPTAIVNWGEHLFLEARKMVSANLTVFKLAFRILQM